MNWIILFSQHRQTIQTAILKIHPPIAAEQRPNKERHWPAARKPWRGASWVEFSSKVSACMVAMLALDGDTVWKEVFGNTLVWCAALRCKNYSRASKSEKDILVYFPLKPGRLIVFFFFFLVKQILQRRTETDSKPNVDLFIYFALLESLLQSKSAKTWESYQNKPCFWKFRYLSHLMCLCTSGEPWQISDILSWWSLKTRYMFWNAAE